MENIPIKKGIEERLEARGADFPGVWKVKGKGKYLKFTSKLHAAPVKIPLSDYAEPKQAVKDVIICAKVYKKFIEKGLYFPSGTRIVIYKDDEDNLGLLIIQSELKPKRKNGLTLQLIGNKLEDLAKELGLKGYDSKGYDASKGCEYWNWRDLKNWYNWGYEKINLRNLFKWVCGKKGNIYAHDLHITYDGGYKSILKLAKGMGIK